MFYTTCSGEKVCYSTFSETIDTVILSQLQPFLSHFRCDAIFQFFFRKSKIQRICVRFQLCELVYVREFGEKVVVKLQHSQFSVVKIEEPDNYGLFVFNLCFGEFNFIQRIVHMLWLLEQFTTTSCICFFVTELLHNSLLAPIHDLVTVGAAG